MTRLLPALFLAVAIIPLAGCGSRLTPVTGVVTLDGKPVAGAAVTFLSDDGKYTASGVTDDSGNFTLAHSTGPGTFPGNYKVTVTKYPKVEGVSPAIAQDGKMDKAYEAAMKKQMDASKNPGGVKTGSGIKAPPGMMMPGGAAGSSAKSELPEVYASVEKTPFTIKVPADGSVQLDLKSK